MIHIGTFHFLAPLALKRNNGNTKSTKQHLILLEKRWQTFRMYLIHGK